MTDSEKLELLKGLIERQGFQVVEGDFVLKNGTHSPYALRPVDARMMLRHATAVMDRE